MEDINIPKITNLCYITKEGMVLLQKKARGFGIGKWNAPGGKKEANESIEKSVIREIKEETNISIQAPAYIGYHEFIFESKTEWNNICHIFKTSNFTGDPKDMGEGELKWYKFDEIPLDEMWDDDNFWTKDMLDGKFRNMRFYFSDEGKYIKHEIINI